MSYKPQKKITNFDKRISAFIDVETFMEKKDTKNFLSRHSTKLKFVKPSQKKIELLIPINDHGISCSLSKVLFCHPFLPIGLLNDSNRQTIPNDKLNEILLPFQLYTETSNEPTSQMLIPQLANLFSMKVTEFLIYYKGKQTKTKIIKDNWKSLFSRSSLSQTEIDDQMKVFFDRLVSRFPDEDWELKSLDDLYSLHVLACSMNMQFYLIFPRIPEKSLSTYSLRIGMANRHKYEIYIVVQSSNQFSIAQPLNYKKILDPAKDEADQGHHKRSKKFNFLNTFETIDQNFALYYNYKKNLFHMHNDKKFENIESQLVEKTNINCPLLAIHSKDSQISIDAEIPSFNEENTALLTSFLESISDKFNQTQSIEDTENDDLSSKTFTISCKNAYKVMGSDKFYIVSRETREKEHEKTLDEIGLASKPQDLNAPCYEVVRNQMVYVGDQENGDLPENDALRIVLGSQLSKEEGLIQEEIEDKDKDLNEVTLFDQSGVSFEELIKSRQPPSLTPLFLPQKSRITLAQCARSKYAEDLCTLSVLKYCAGHVKCSRTCSRCGNIIDQQTLMLPYKKSPLEEILFTCHRCNRKHDNTKTLTMNQHDTLLYKLSTKSHDTNTSSAVFIKEIDSYIKIYEENINFLREHPIGHLRQMHSLIDAAFATLQKIIASHKVLSSSGPTISLHSMLGIRDIKEAEIQLKNLTSDYTEEPVSSDLFVEYLSKQTDIQYSSQQYQLVKKPEEIVKDLDQITASIFNDMTFKVIDECPVKEVNGKPQKILPLYNVRAFPDPINHIMNVKFNFPGKENQKRIVNKYQYKTFVLRNANHLSLSPESTIATSKDIIYLWKYNKKTILILAQGEVLEESDKANEIYKDVYLYLVPLGNVNLEFCTPLMVFKGSIVKCADFNQTSSSHQLAICINTLMSQKLLLIDVGSRTKLCQTSEVELTNVYNIKYGTDDLYAVAEDDDGQMVVHVVSSAGIIKTKHHFPAIHDETTNEIIKTLELVGSPRYMLAVLRDGTVHELSNNEEEEADEAEGDEKENNEEENEGENSGNENEEENENEVESVYSNLDGVSIDSPIVKTMLGTDQGLANIVQKFDENNEFTGEFDVHFYPSQEPSPKFSISFGHINDHQPFFNQYGIYKDNAKDKPLNDDDDDDENEGNENALDVNRYIWNIHLTAAEFFPALIAYESHGLMFLVQKNMEQFREVNCNNFFASAIQSFYSRTFSKMSLHHVEDVIREHGLKVNIVTFLCDMVESKMAQFIDTIFGTKFSTVSINGVWVGIRVIGKTAHVIIYFHGNNSNKLNELRLTAAIRASNLIMINSYRIINTFNFMKQYQDDVPKFHFLINHYPKIMTMYFQESENNLVDIDSIWQYRSIKNIKTNFCFVPYRPSWNTSGIDDLLEKADNVDDEEEEEDADDDETIAQIFIKQINDLLGFNKKSEKEKKQIKASYRKLLPPEKGINMVCQIITTYLTLFEFQDLPVKTVLPYCKLNSPK